MDPHTFRPRSSAMASAMAVLLGGLCLPAAHAAVVTTQVAGFATASGTVTDTCGTVATTSCAESVSPTTALAATNLPLSFNQFDASQGVLVGVTVDLLSTRTQTVSGTVANARGKGKGDPGTSSQARGVSGASFEALGAGSTALATAFLSDSSGFGASSTGARLTVGTATNATLTVAASNLDAYVGSGTTSVGLQLNGVQAFSRFSNGVANETVSTANYSVAWDGTVAMNHEYLEHARAAFDAQGTQSVLNIDFGTHQVGASVGAQVFSIFNAVGATGVGLDLDGFDAVDPVFSTDLAQFFGLGAGGANAFSVGFDTSTAGVFASSIRLRLSDADVGAASTRFGDYGLTINLSGTVQRMTNHVPEPSALALVSLGLVGLVSGRRRRQVGPAGPLRPA